MNAPVCAGPVRLALAEASGFANVVAPMLTVLAAEPFSRIELLNLVWLAMSWTSVSRPWYSLSM